MSDEPEQIILGELLAQTIERAGVGSAAAKIDNLCRSPIAKTAALSWPDRIALNAGRRQSIIAARFGT